MNGGNIEKFWHKVAAYTEGFREANERATVNLRHFDGMAVWMIGMAGAAVIAVPTVLNYIVDIKNLSRWALTLAVGPFAVAVLIGICYRWILAEMMEADSKFGFKKIHALEAFQLNKFDDEQELGQLEKQFEAIQDNKVVGLSELAKDRDKWKLPAKLLGLWLYILFGGGIVITAIVAIFAPVSTPAASHGNSAAVQVVRAIDGDFRLSIGGEGEIAWIGWSGWED
ncbi:MAG: hypothetical protein ACE5MK_08220 [Acidobacteriota bacterium]